MIFYGQQFGCQPKRTEHAFSLAEVPGTEVVCGSDSGVTSGVKVTSLELLPTFHLG